jgi:hypothetical protein
MEWLPQHLHRLQNPHLTKSTELKALDMTIQYWIGLATSSPMPVYHTPQNLVRVGTEIVTLIEIWSWIGLATSSSSTPVYNNSEI